MSALQIQERLCFVWEIFLCGSKLSAYCCRILMRVLRLMLLNKISWDDLLPIHVYVSQHQAPQCLENWLSINKPCFLSLIFLSFLDVAVSVLYCFLQVIHRSNVSSNNALIFVRSAEGQKEHPFNRSNNRTGHVLFEKASIKWNLCELSMSHLRA